MLSSTSKKEEKQEEKTEDRITILCKEIELKSQRSIQWDKTTKKLQFSDYDQNLHFIMSNEQKKDITLKELDTFPVTKTLQIKAGILCSESSILSILPELSKHVEIIIFADIDSTVHKNIAHLLTCLKEAKTREEFRECYLKEDSIRKADFEILKTTTAEYLKEKSFLSSEERFSVCKKALEKVQFAHTHLNLMVMEHCSALKSILVKHNAYIQIANFTNLHDYDDQGRLPKTVPILLEKDTQPYILFSKQNGSVYRDGKEFYTLMSHITMGYESYTKEALKKSCAINHQNSINQSLKIIEDYINSRLRMIHEGEKGKELLFYRSHSPTISITYNKRERRVVCIAKSLISSEDELDYFDRGKKYSTDYHTKICETLGLDQKKVIESSEFLDFRKLLESINTSSNSSSPTGIAESLLKEFYSNHPTKKRKQNPVTLLPDQLFLIDTFNPDELFLEGLLKNDIQKCKEGLDLGADINKPLSHYNKKDADTFPELNPLHYAVQNKNFQLVEFLLANKASIKSASTADETVLMKAASNRDLDILNLLLESKANPNQRSSKGLTVMHALCLGLEFACFKDHMAEVSDIMDLLFKKGFAENRTKIIGELYTLVKEKTIVDAFSECWIKKEKSLEFFDTSTASLFDQGLFKAIHPPTTTTPTAIIPTSSITGSETPPSFEDDMLNDILNFNPGSV